jgi:hypothetical protein
MAYTTDEMYAGDGCHPDEAQALSDYLHGKFNEQETAERITAAIINETSPSQETYRLWGLLSEALVELSDRDQHKTLDLLAEIRTLPPTSDIQWTQLPGFSSMWYDLYKSHLQGGCGIGIFDPEHQDELRRTFEVAGRAEAEMLIRHFGVVDEQRGYLTLNQVCSDGPEVEILISEVFGWLEVAGSKLKEKAESETTVRKYSRSLDGDYRKKHTVEGTLAEHWVVWKDRLWRISQGETGLSKIAKGLAAQCHELM